MWEILLINIFAGSLTYTADIKPIFKNRCVMCHSKNTPQRNWMDYDIAFRKRKLIRYRMAFLKNMPPKGFKITDAEIEKIKLWVENGAKK